MKRSELILEFIDGTLDGNAEQQLFEELARQPEYRSEMRQFIAIGDAVRADREAFMPPYEVEQALMAGLGLAPLAGGLAGGASAGAGAAADPAGFLAGLLGKLGLMKGLLPFVASFMLGGLVIGGGVYLNMKDADPSMALSAGGATNDRGPVSTGAPGASVPGSAGANLAPTNPSAPVSTTHPNVTSSAAQPISPVAPSPARRSNGFSERSPRYSAPRSTRSVSISRETSPNLTSEQPSSDPVVTDSNAMSTTLPAAVSSTSLRDATPLVVDSSLLNGSRSPNAMRPIDMPNQEDRSTPNHFIAEVRGSATLLRNMNEARVHGPQPLDPFAGGFYYRANESYLFGVEGGRERYWETYFDKRRDAGNNEVVVRTDQAPLLYWAGFTGRYMAADLLDLDGFTPFAQLTVGAASHGPLARARIGFDIDLSSQFSLTAAGEGSTLVYFYNTQSMASTNAGFTLGLQYRLW